MNIGFIHIIIITAIVGFLASYWITTITMNKKTAVSNARQIVDEDDLILNPLDSRTKNGSLLEEWLDKRNL